MLKKLFQKAQKIRRPEQKIVAMVSGLWCVAVTAALLCVYVSSPSAPPALHRVLVHLGNVCHHDGARVARFRLRGRFQHGGALLLRLLPLLPLLLFLLLVQHAVVDAHPDKQEDAGDDEDDAAGQVGVVVMVVVVVESTWRKKMGG